MAESQGLDPRHDPIYQRGYDPAVHGDIAASSAEQAPSRRSRVRHTADEQRFAPPGAPERERPPSARPRAEAGAAGGDGAGVGWIAPPDPSSSAGTGVRNARSAQGETGTEAETGPANGIASDRILVVGGPDVASESARDAGADAASVPPWRNPYLVGLTVAGVVLAVAGFQMFRAALQTIYVDFARSGVIYGEAPAEDAPDPTDQLVSMQLGWSLGPLLFLLGIAAVLSVLIFIAVRWRPTRKASAPSDAATGDGPLTDAERP